jgi:hypothetical protein
MHFKQISNSVFFNCIKISFHCKITVLHRHAHVNVLLLGGNLKPLNLRFIIDLLYISLEFKNLEICITNSLPIFLTDYPTFIAFAV